jgi:DNA repair photolyase
MGLNKAQGNMYEFLSHTWNAVKGKCAHECGYCYMTRFGEQKPIRLHNKELKTDLGEGNFIFVGSSCDMFAPDVPDEWIEAVIAHCKDYSRNKYLFQSKNPARMAGFKSLEELNPVICTTIETNRWYGDIMNSCPIPQQRADGMALLPFTKYVTIEPIMDFDVDEMVALIKKCNPIQVNIGADTGNNNLPEPNFDKVIELNNQLKQFTVIANKRNLSRLENKD